MIKVHFKGAVIECETDLVCRQVLEQIASLQHPITPEQLVSDNLYETVDGRTLNAEIIGKPLADRIANRSDSEPVEAYTHGRSRTVLTARSLKVGDRFRFKIPPPGWSSGNLLVVDKLSGHAMPEGWDFFDIRVLDSEVELIEERPIVMDRKEYPLPPGEYDAKQCQHCGVLLIKGPTEMDLERYERGMCGGCQ